MLLEVAVLIPVRRQPTTMVAVRDALAVALRALPAPVTVPVAEKGGRGRGRRPRLRRSRSAPALGGSRRRAHTPPPAPPSARRVLRRAARAARACAIALVRSHIADATPGVARATRANTVRNAAPPPRAAPRAFARRPPPKVAPRETAETRPRSRASPEREVVFADDASVVGSGGRVPLKSARAHGRPRRIRALPPALVQEDPPPIPTVKQPDATAMAIARVRRELRENALEALRARARIGENAISLQV